MAAWAARGSRLVDLETWDLQKRKLEIVTSKHTRDSPTSITLKMDRYLGHNIALDDHKKKATASKSSFLINVKK